MWKNLNKMTSVSSNVDTKIERIVFVDNSLIDFYNFRGFIAKLLLDRGYEITLLTPPSDNKELQSYIESIGVKLEYYNLPLKISPIKDLKLLYDYYKSFKRINPDLIFHYTIKPNIYGSIAGFLSNKRTVSIIPGLGLSFSKDSLLQNIVVQMYKVALKVPEKVWVLNNDDYNTLLAKKIVNHNKLEVLYGEGVDTEYFNPNMIEKNESIFTFLYIGRMIKEKGVEVLVESVKKIRVKYPHLMFNVKLLGGFSRSSSSGSITEEQVNSWQKEGFIDYLGEVSDVRPIIRDSDCIILPSFYGEGVPRSLMEAASMGKMIITTDNVGCREVVVDDFNGFLCKAKSSIDLSAKMYKALLLSVDERNILGRNGRQRMIDLFDKSIVESRYLSLIEELNIH